MRVIHRRIRADLWELGVCPAIQISLSDKKFIPGKSSLCGSRPLSKFFVVVKREVEMFLS